MSLPRILVRKVGEICLICTSKFQTVLNFSSKITILHVMQITKTTKDTLETLIFFGKK